MCTTPTRAPVNEETNGLTRPHGGGIYLRGSIGQGQKITRQDGPRLPSHKILWLGANLGLPALLPVLFPRRFPIIKVDAFLWKKKPTNILETINVISFDLILGRESGVTSHQRVETRFDTRPVDMFAWIIGLRSNRRPPSFPQLATSGAPL